MKIWGYSLLICILVTVPFLSCDCLFDDDDDDDDDDDNEDIDDRFQLIVQVFDNAGLPLSGASVYLDGNRLDGMSGTDGSARFRLDEPGAGYGLSVVLEGYVINSQIIRLAVGTSRLVVPVWLMEVGRTQEIDPTRENTVSHNGADLVIPANSLVDEKGDPVTDTATIEFTYVEPGPDLRMIGNFEIEGDPDQMLVSFGVVAIQASRDGEPIDLAPGFEAEVSIPQVGDSLKTQKDVETKNGDSSPPVWRRNTVTGNWELIDQVWDPVQGRWVTHVYAVRAVYNADIPTYLNCVQGFITGIDGKPMPGIVIIGMILPTGATTTSGFSVQTVTSGADGLFCMTMPRDSVVALTVTCQDGESYSTPALEVGSAQNVCQGDACVGSDVLEVKCCYTDEDCNEGRTCVAGECVSSGGGGDSCTIEELCVKIAECFQVTYDLCVQTFTEYAPDYCEDFDEVVACLCPCVVEDMSCSECDTHAESCEGYCGDIFGF